MTATTPLIEQVARTICIFDNPCPRPVCTQCAKQAEDAIREAWGFLQQTGWLEKSEKFETFARENGIELGEKVE